MRKKAENKVINKIADDFVKIVAVTKLNVLKRYVKKTIKLQKMKNTKSKIKPIKWENNLEQRIVLSVKIIPRILRHKKRK